VADGGAGGEKGRHSGEAVVGAVELKSPQEHCDEWKDGDYDYAALR
jgi:hypothetical protein